MARHAKFWHVIFNETTRMYMVAWGPIRSGKAGDKEYTEKQITTKIREKRRKGYTKVDGYDETIGQTSVHYITQVCTQE